MAKEYYSFAEVLRELQIEEADLKKLVSEGDINAINDGVSIRFAKSEIDNIRNSKMDAGTMLVPSNHSEDVMIVEDLSESEAISAVDDLSSSVTLEAEFADSDSSAFVNIDDSSPLLSMDDSEEDNQPILNMSSEIRKSKTKDVKEDTEELIFEQSSGEDLLETGELLFDSVNQVLPRDREEAELFTESEMGISDDYYDDIDEASVKAAIDFVDSSDEEPISTSTPKSGLNFSASEVQKRQRMKSVAGISVGLLTLGVIALFFIFPPDPTSKILTVTPYTVGQISSHKEYRYDSEVTSVRSEVISATISGKVTDILPKDSKVQKGQKVATITGENLEIKTKFDELNSKYQKGFERYKSMKPNEGKYKQAYMEYQKKKKAGEKADLPREVKMYLSLKKGLPKLSKELKRLKTQLDNPPVIQVSSNADGILEQVYVAQNAQVTKNDKLYSLGETHELLCSFRIPKGDSNNWKKNDSLEIKVDNQKELYTGTVEDIRENDTTKPVTLGVYLRIKNENQQILPGTKVSLEYTKEFQVLAIPKKVVYEQENKTYVYVILEDKNKVLKREVQLGETYPNDYIRVINNLYMNDKIVSDNTLTLEDNQDIHITTDK